MKNFATDQEKFWAGDFGDGYASRNKGDEFLASQLNFFSKILTKTQRIGSVIEYGANIGENLKVLGELLPKAKYAAVEINESASSEITKWSAGKVKVFNESILDFKSFEKYDLAFVKGVLIHINPEELNKVYDSLYETSSKYIMIGEYYNPSPVGIDYRGHKNRLFKRDFCSEMMDRHPDLDLIEYGFSYHRDPNFPQDDITWFLLEK